MIPREISSVNGAIRIEILKDTYTIDLAPVIVQEVGSYHRCKVRVSFIEGKGVTVIPIFDRG